MAVKKANKTSSNPVTRRIHVQSYTVAYPSSDTYRAKIDKMPECVPKSKILKKDK